MGKQAEEQHPVGGKAAAQLGIHRLNKVEGQQLDVLRRLLLLLHLGLEGVVAHQVDADIGALRIGQMHLEGLLQPPGDKGGGIHLLLGKFLVGGKEFLLNLVSVAQTEDADSDVGGQGGKVFAAHEEVKFFFRFLDDAANLFNVLLCVNLLHLFQPLLRQADRVVHLPLHRRLPVLAQVKKADDSGPAVHLLPSDADAPALYLEEPQVVLGQPVFRPVQVGENDETADIKAVSQKLDGKLITGENKASQQLSASLHASIGEGEILAAQEGGELLAAGGIAIQLGAVALLFNNLYLRQLMLPQPAFRFVQVVLHRPLGDFHNP